MSGTHSHIPKSEAAHFQHQIGLIVNALHPVRIVCYGVRTEIKELWSCFLSTFEPVRSVNIDLLIITKELAREKEHESLDKINRICDAGVIQTSAVIHCITAVKEALEKGSTFFGEVYTKGEIVYHNDAASDPIFLDVLTPLESIEKAKRHWAKWFSLGTNFYESACEIAQKQRNDVAVFLLHQSVELMSIAVIRVCMGYKPSTHNLKRLLSIMENFTSESARIFPRSTTEEVELFDVLCKAYSEVRYKEAYSISESMVTVLLARVKSFRTLAENLYIRRVKELTMYVDLINDSRETLPSDSKAKFTSVREISGFEIIELDTFAEVILIKGERESIVVESGENTEQVIKTTVEGKRLWITTVSDGQRILPETTIYITYMTLMGLTVNHAHAISCRGPIEVSRLGILQNCKRSIHLTVDVQMLDVTLTKAGGVTVTGATGDLKILNHGAGIFNGSELEADSVSVTIRGAGNVLVKADEELSVILEGAGSVFYEGMPRLKSIDHTGEGKLKQL